MSYKPITYFPWKFVVQCVNNIIIYIHIHICTYNIKTIILFQAFLKKKQVQISQQKFRCVDIVTWKAFKTKTSFKGTGSSWTKKKTWKPLGAPFRRLQRVAERRLMLSYITKHNSSCIPKSLYSQSQSPFKIIKTDTSTIIQ